MNHDISLKDKCEIATQEEGNRFVGVKVSITDVKIFFPLGYQLPKSDEEIHTDIFNLLNILNLFKAKNDYLIPHSSFKSQKKLNFPLNSYIEVINYYMENGYYIENEYAYSTKSKGKINWAKTIKNQKPLLQEDFKNKRTYPLYLSFTVKELNTNLNNDITNIHKYCVFESFEKIGWLFTSHIPPKPIEKFNEMKFLSVLHKKLNNTNNDVKRKLFYAMIEIIKYCANTKDDEEFFFGTDRFEYIWEKLIDATFGVKNKNDYFPRAEWNLLYNKNKQTHPLQPDTIMIHGEKIFVIDSKYYKYGETKKPKDLPNSSSISKQITYAEYIKENKNFNEDSIFNAFLMPYNMENNLFDNDEPFVNIGEAISKWKRNGFQYEHVQGILVDVRYLMHSYNKNSNNNIQRLAEVIEKAYEENINHFGNNAV